ncbi:hypothetical protein HFN_0617 [Helicobacter fennelliae MRY12-0050]|uniref:Uncharacterized protein n=1 Tax=Helicobacter fennelliae MRY12-0050 TaxID=1325130 RepID=T1DUN0_9HELI|nr:hypothetical protein HFN_0617 [Helicobacter fennelliae MRY12-0050]
MSYFAYIINQKLKILWENCKIYSSDKAVSKDNSTILIIGLLSAYYQK